MKEEYLDIVNEKGEPTGETIERNAAHALGIRHRTSHVWLLRKKEGEVQILLQKRSDNKDSHPGCYDISSAGHIPAGIDFLSSAIRELEEELGVNVPLPHVRNFTESLFMIIRSAIYMFCGWIRKRENLSCKGKRFLKSYG